LASQFEALEEPGDAITVSIDRSETEIVEEIMQALASDDGPKAP
jgi:gluconate kinase